MSKNAGKVANEVYDVQRSKKKILEMLKSFAKMWKEMSNLLI
jgi:hypothetical protein